MPLDLTSFVGRRRELTTTKRLIGTSRLVTLAGPGGVGKTRLALRAAADSHGSFYDGVWFIEFGERRDPQLVPEVVAATFGFREQSVASTTQILIDYLSSRRALLVLDNCEHLIDGVAKLVDALLRASSELCILATSREPLAIGGETVLQVPPLTFPPSDQDVPLRALEQYEAVNLFVERAATVVPGFELKDDNREAIIAICAKLDGLPLAIELATARLRAISVDQVLVRLTDRFRLLTGGSRSVPDRQKTLQMSIDWSHQLCTPTEQKLWRRLSVFLQGFELDAAEAIASAGLTAHDLLDVVGSLVDKSILIREEHAGVVWYRLLETLRVYGFERLKEAGEHLAMRRRHRDWYQALLRRYAVEWIGPNQAEWIARLDREQSNLRSALEYCTTEPGEAENGLRMVNALYILWISRGQFNEGRLWLDRILVAQDGESTRQRAEALSAEVMLAANQGDIETGARLLAEARDVAAAINDPDTDVVVTHAAGHLAIFAGDSAKAEQLFGAILPRLRTGHDYLRRVATLLGLSMASVALGKRRETIEYTDEVLTITTARRETIYRSFALRTRGLAQLQDGRGDAKRLFLEALKLSAMVDDRLGIVTSVEALACDAATTEEAHRAAVLLGAADSLWLSVGKRDVVIPALRENHENARGRAHSILGERSFEAATLQGSHLVLDDILAFAVEGPMRSAAPTDRTVPELTPREQEVARLVAQGLTNKAIAARLVISQRTVQGHVEHVLVKLGFKSRTQIAAWVIEHGRRPDAAT